jgi:hypothetical protein
MPTISAISPVAMAKGRGDNEADGAYFHTGGDQGGKATLDEIANC